MTSAARSILALLTILLAPACGEAPELGSEAVWSGSGKADGTNPCGAGEGMMQQADGGLWLWNQPPTGETDWSGQCGNTAAANYILHACDWCLSPKDLDYEWDGLPGSRPSTVRDLINNVPACRKVRLFEGSTSKDLTPRQLCAHAAPANPVPILINQNGNKKKFHWINLLGCNCRLEGDGSWSGEVRYATWGSTPSSTCDELRGWLDDIPWPYADANWISR